MLQFVELGGQFDDGQGNPLSGTVTFTPNTTVYSSGIPVLSVDTPISAQVIDGVLRNSSGGTLQLLATDNSGLTFAGQTGFLFYSCSMVLAGQVLVTWSFFLPFGTLGAGPIDLMSLANTGTGGGGSGTVTSVAVEAANGFTGTVADSTTTPQLTLETTVTGLLKGNGAAISAAAAGTDFLAPNSSGAALTGITAAQVGADASGAAASKLPLGGGTMSGPIAMGGSKVTGLANGSAGTDAAAFGQLPSSGSPLALTSGGTGQSAGSASALLGTLGAAQLSGAAFTGEVTVQAPVGPSDAVTKAYADAIAQSLAVKPSVQEATAAALPSNTYASGVLTATANGALTVDGITVSAGDRVLVQNEASAANNGIYTCTATGSAGTPYVLTRAADMVSGPQIPGAFVFTEQGTVNAGSGFTVASKGPFTPGTTAITWTQFSGAGEILPGTGLTKSGNTLSSTGVLSAAAADTSVVVGGSGAAPTFRTGTLDVIAAQHPPAAAVGMNSQKITSLANGTAGSDAAAFGQIPASASTIGGLLKAGNLSDLASIPAARTTLAPWLFDVTSPAYGAAGNGQVAADGAMTASSATLACTTSTPFSAGDVGKTVIVNGAGPTAHGMGIALVTTIAAVADSGHVTLAAAASNTVSGAAVLWWADDTTAIQAAINAAAAYAGVHGYAMVYRPVPPAGVFYGVSGPLVTTGDANSQLVIPAPSATNPQCTLEFYAEQGPSVINMWTQTALPQVAGAIVSSGLFSSAGAAVSNYGGNGPSAVLGSTPSVTSLLPHVDGLPAFANVNVVVRNWTTVRPQNADGLTYTGVNLEGVAKGMIEDSASLLTCNYSTGSGPNQFPPTSSLQNAVSRGFILPGNGNNDQAVGRNLTASGDAFAFQLGEHAHLEDSKSVGCSFAYQVSGNDGAANGHGVKIVNGSVENTSFGFWLVGGGESGVGFFIDAEIDVETLAAGGLIQDNNSGGGLSSLFGQIRVSGQHSLNIYPTGWPTSVKLICMGGNSGQLPGWVFGYGGFASAGTAVQNPYWRDARVYFSGGTISAVKAGVTLGGSGGSAVTAPAMTATGLSGSGVVDWPSGGWLSFTFTGTPTWNVCVPA